MSGENRGGDHLFPPKNNACMSKGLAKSADELTPTKCRLKTCFYEQNVTENTGAPFMMVESAQKVKTNRILIS